MVERVLRFKLYHGFSCGYFREKLHDDDKLVSFQNIYIYTQQINASQMIGR